MGIENGYVNVYAPKNPMAKSNGCVLLHRLVASEKIGRSLDSSEHVHHIDGNRTNNDPNNLMILSNSEHIKIEQEKLGHIKITYYCLNCGEQLFEETKTGLCYNCYCISKRQFNPSKEELEKLVWEMPTVRVARIYGISDNAVGKRCKILGINKPPRGYWRKLQTGKL